jgi:hypothetical protein
VFYRFPSRSLRRIGLSSALGGRLLGCRWVICTVLVGRVGVPGLVTCASRIILCSSVFRKFVIVNNTCVVLFSFS